MKNFLMLLFAASLIVSVPASESAGADNQAALAPMNVDIDNDCYPETIFAGTRGLYCLNNSGDLLWQYEVDGTVKSSPVVAELNQDGNLEVLLGVSGLRLIGGSNIAECANYGSIVTGSADWGGGGTERHFLNNQHNARIRQNGIVTRIRFYMAKKPSTLRSFYFEIWRKKDNGLWDRISQEDILSKLAGGQINDVVLDNPVSVNEGDYIGYGWECSAYEYYFKSAVGTGAASYYITNKAYSPTDYNWAYQTQQLPNYLPIKVFMESPAVILMGDSIIAGHPSHYSYIESSQIDNLHSTIGYALGNILGCSYQSMGIGSQATSSIASRFTNDVVNLKPKFAVIEGGVNDISLGGTQETFINNWTYMLNSCQANGITPVVVLIAPWTNGTNAQMQIRDTWNSALTALAQSYNAIIVDVSSRVGMNRPSGDLNNLWDIKPEYNQDRVHFNAAGNAQIAQAIADAIKQYASVTYVLHCIDGNGRLLWRYEIASENCSAPTIADLHNDGRPEILIESEKGNVYCINYDGQLSWQYNTAS